MTGATRAGSSLLCDGSRPPEWVEQVGGGVGGVEEDGGGVETSGRWSVCVAASRQMVSVRVATWWIMSLCVSMVELDCCAEAWSTTLWTFSP